MINIITISNLVKDFGSHRAINNLSFEVHAGEVFGLLGPNGAGKTTTIRLLNGLLPITAGEVRVFGKDPFVDGAAVRSMVGVLTETPELYERLSARENLRFFGKLCGIPVAELDYKINKVLNAFGLENRMEDSVGGFSKGMKQRMALVRALLHQPSLLFLDEPTSSLDPESALQVNDMIGRISHDDGWTVFLCTHNLVEAQRLCDRLAIINNGELLAIGSMEKLSRSVFPGIWVDIEFLRSVPGTIKTILSEHPGIQNLIFEDAAISILVSGKDVVADIVTIMVNMGALITRVSPRDITLEDVYFSLQNQKSGAV